MRSSVAASCGDVRGITVSIAASPSRLVTGAATAATPGSSRSSPASAPIASRSPWSGVDAASSSGPFAPGPKPWETRS